MVLASDVNRTEYDSYFNTYIKLTEGDLLEHLEKDMEAIASYLDNIPEEKHHYAYDTGKWTIAQLIQHCVDTERVFQYRAFSIARGEKGMLNGYDENAYTDATPTQSIDFKILLEEMHGLRQSTQTMFKNMTKVNLGNIGQAGGNPLSSRAAGFIILGHWNHHMNILKTRYLDL